MSNHCMYNPHFNRAYSMVQQVTDRHSDEIMTLKMSWHEHKDADGVVYQLTPWLDVQFKF